MLYHLFKLFHPFFQPTVVWVPWRHFTTSNLKEEEIAHACLNNKMDEDWHFPSGAWCEMRTQFIIDGNLRIERRITSEWSASKRSKKGWRNLLITYILHQIIGIVQEQKFTYFSVYAASNTLKFGWCTLKSFNKQH